MQIKAFKQYSQNLLEIEQAWPIEQLFIHSHF